MTVGAVEFQAHAKQRSDWLTRLTPFEEWYGDHGTNRIPLATLLETMAEADVPMVYQALLRPLADCMDAADYRQQCLEHGETGGLQEFLDVAVGHEPDAEPTTAQRHRIEALDRRDHTHPFVFTARVVAAGPADGVERALTGICQTFGSVGGPFHRIEGVTQPADAIEVLDDLVTRTPYSPSYDRLATHLPFVSNVSRGIVASAAEVGSFCLLDGAGLTSEGARALEATPGERTALSPPPSTVLDRYSGAGMPLGRPLSADDEPIDEPVVLPPDHQLWHLVWLGKTGAGKTAAANTAVLANHRSTSGATFVLEPKGGDATGNLPQSLYAQQDHLDDVRYFDCAEVLPALSFFDIRPDLDAGVSRATAVEDRVAHFVEILESVVDDDQYGRAIRSTDLIEVLVRAAYDPAHGGDEFTLRDLYDLVDQLDPDDPVPPTSDPDIQRIFRSVVESHRDTFDMVLGGVRTRIEALLRDKRLSRVFNHRTDTGGPDLDLDALLDEDVVVVLDMGELRPEGQRVLTLVVLSMLWTALQRRAQRGVGEQSPVNVHVEEAAQIAVSDLLTQFLAQARGFDCSLSLSMQFPD
jgi:hypothetical protein